MPAPTSTSRLGLVKPDPNPTTGDFVDITTLNTDFDKIDAAVGAFPCTSATRPIAPNLWDGRVIRETDTRRMLVWNATQAVWDPVNGPFLCSSGSRPPTPFVNMMIRETDTRRMYIWNATEAVWDKIADPVGPPPGFLFARRTSNAAPVQNSTMANDTQLTVNVESGGVYRVDSQIIYTSPQAADFQIGFAAPAGSTMEWSSWGQGAATTTFEGIIKVEERTLAQTAQIGGADAAIITCRPSGLLIAGATGAFTFRWAQFTTTASNTLIYDKSWIELMRVG